MNLDASGKETLKKPSSEVNCTLLILPLSRTKYTTLRGALWQRTMLCPGGAAAGLQLFVAQMGNGQRSSCGCSRLHLAWLADRWGWSLGLLVAGGKQGACHSGGAKKREQTAHGCFRKKD